MADADGAAQPRATGLVPIEEVRAMSGLDFLRRIASGELPGAPISGVLAFEPTTVEHGRVVFAGTPELRFYNPIGVVHGGWAATLLDSCMGCAVHSTLEPGQGYTMVEIKVSFVRPLTASTGRVEAEGRVIHSGRLIATAEGRLVDSAGRLYAHGTTTCLILQI